MLDKSCPVCGKPLKRFSSVYLKTCGARECSNIIRKQTNLEKYGHECNLHTPDGQEDDSTGDAPTLLLRGDVVDTSPDGQDLHIALYHPYNSWFGRDKLWFNVNTSLNVKFILKDA